MTLSIKFQPTHLRMEFFSNRCMV